jgi:hypothetical protein
MGHLSSLVLSVIGNEQLADFSATISLTIDHPIGAQSCDVEVRIGIFKIPVSRV